MLTIIYNKLIRDNIDSIMTEKGVKFSVRTLEDEEYRSALLAKVVEEAKELQDAKTADDVLSELADVQAVVDVTREAFNISVEQLENEKKKKEESRGGFKRKLFLEWTK
ncbi:MAG: nucleoside triphosphate pyrophosphohydrolase [Patescibacteria group bacterium]